MKKIPIESYEYSFRVTGYYTVCIEAPADEAGAERAYERACEEVNRADFGDLQDTDIEYDC